LNAEQIDKLQADLGIPSGLLNLNNVKGNEWDPLPSDTTLATEMQKVIKDSACRKGLSGPAIASSRRLSDPDTLDVPDTLTYRKASKMSTQEAFGRIMTDIARSKTEVADRIVTVSPDVASSVCKYQPFFNLSTRPIYLDSLISEGFLALQRSGIC
jgi:pyruvate dehydrogenase E1 component